MTKYVRFQHNHTISYGILEGDTVRAIEGDLFGSLRESGARHPLDAVTLLCPCQPPKLLAVGLNYKSHLRDRPAPAHPEMFYKPTSALLAPGCPIVLPPDSSNVHFEGELVVVIGRRVRNVSPEQAREAIFGVTCGNDVSEREWQNGSQKDRQWWRAKGSDTFAPLGPAIVTGLDDSNLALQTRLNGKVMQEQRTSDLLFDCATVVAWVTRYVTLFPGDVIYTGTPGNTTRMSPGDVVEVEIEGIGVLRNPVAGA